MYGSYEEIFCRAQLSFALKSFPFLPIRHGQKVTHFPFCLPVRKKVSFPPLGQKKKILFRLPARKYQIFFSARQFRPERNSLLQTLSGLALPVSRRFQAAPVCLSSANFGWKFPASARRLVGHHLRACESSPQPWANCGGSSLAPPPVKAGQKFRLLSLGVPSAG